MILVFGGTTEGRKAVEVLEEGGSPYFYSTKTGEQDITLQHGVRIDGALDEAAMMHFCTEHGIRMIVDAAHPFAALLHQTIAKTASALSLPVVRFERIYPPCDPAITWIDDYTQIPHDIHSLLATTGVQSISKLKPLAADGISIFYRILNRPSSIALALKQGATQAQLCYYDDPNDIPVQADAILLKESGLSGGFTEKVVAAKACGMRVIAIKRPEQPKSFIVVDGPYGLRRMVEKLLPEFYPLHSGLTTGTCATAAAVAACIRLTSGEMPAEVPVMLPNGETIHVAVSYGDDYVACIKEAGDDPDVTNGIEVRAQVTESDHFEILGGEGVGRFTLPGFDYPPGEAAINKAPREMIRQNLERLKMEDGRLKIVISVPQGAEIARRTFNPRLGIEGGISIIGVSGIVKPFSEEAFVDSIRKCMTVAKASQSARVVINSGGKSERFVKALYPELPQQAFVEYGNYIGETLKIAHELDIRSITLGVMIGKAVKLAAGHLDTHSKRATMDKAFISEMLHEAHCDIDISDITLAREIWERLSPEQQQDFADVIISHCAAYCQPLLPNGELTILLIADDGTILPLSPAHQPVPSRS
ncbi:cobalt-precorrin-5B (C(1))-methyltransferase CbiD [Xylanibacter ruminicola]|uniref:Cobalt-precorrin-5B C(1)-methyltransferase n=1 Tax=Xylanibacter ruminicola (strain ATCC 19189 / DSM 19721 / CIP 105475 / JCM 8958 / 23) TaxID=264731 RepID=D5ES12_XYLR2|nr:cobalt-precorrin-5B (C(1))-methyltransferase CbiD [Xylanibacter ruminicola]ADE83041.1 precorrin-6x reductase/cobalamin biosynthetic protein CbiD [Xylanibacter ruminicola 23]